MVAQSDNSEPQSMQELLESIEFKVLKRGEIVEGTVMRVDSDGVFVDIGHKEEGFVPPNEMRTLTTEQTGQLVEGDTLITFVLRTESSDGPILSVDRARGEEGWREIQKYMEADEPVDGQIIGFNRGGCILEVENVQGFVPMSQLMTISRDRFQVDESGSEAAGVESRNSDLIGNTLTVKVLEVNRSRNRAIFSERAAMQEQRDEQKAELIQKLEEGEIRKGRVTGLSNFGAFVDLGGADGLIHISEMSWSMVRSPEDIVSIGQEIDVYILKIDRETMKIALSLRRLEPEPWETIHERYTVGDIVDAKITKLANFGAFARLEDSIEGLIHITELSAAVITNPSEVVSEGEVRKVKILRIEPDRKRLGLSLKQAEDGFTEDVEIIESAQADDHTNEETLEEPVLEDQEKSQEHE
jgi:small subunit ribosomal protein S1